MRQPDEHQVGRIGPTPVGPVHQMMGVEVARARAAGEAADPVPHLERPPQPVGDHPLAPAKMDRIPVAVDHEGLIYVADAGNSRIQQLSPQGEPLAQWGSRGTDPGQFGLFGPHTGMAIDARDKTGLLLLPSTCAGVRRP